MATLRRLCAAALVCLALAGCSEEPARDAGGVAGKTPVVRPEDVHGPGGGRAAVLSPDYRQAMTPGLVAGTEAAAGPEAPRQETPLAGEPAAGRLFAAKSGPGSGTGPAPAPAAPASAVPAVVPGPGVGGPAAAAVPAGPATPPVAATAPVAQPQPALIPSGSGRASTGFPVADSRQLVLVTAADFQATRGTVRRYARSGPGAPWTEIGPAVPCQLGRKGLGVGRGLGQGLSGGPVKRQGDGRTPAGLFPLPAAFGYAGTEAAAAAGVRLPYVTVTDRVSCITDAASPLFGRVVGPDARPGGGLRQDRMVRDDGANAWGVVIGHNSENIDPEAGTCLFVNVRPAGGPPTGGSIGLAPEQAAALAGWLDPAARPLLAVLPEAQYRAQAASWGLP
jgi:L,D-peptidoglycan transpeptidase YkuD (ErfK/YbiS/YcfS/YnhG family)